MKNYCVKCKKEINDPEAKFCPDCGTPLTEKPKDNAEEPIESNKEKVFKETKEQRTVMYCEKCKKEIDDLEAKFCLDCGGPLRVKKLESDRVPKEDNKENSESELDRIQDQSLKSIVFNEIVKPIIKKLSQTLIKLNIGILRILLVVAYLFLGWGVSNLFVSGLTMIAYDGIFTSNTIVTIIIAGTLICLMSCPAIYLKYILNKKAKQKIEQGDTDIYKKSPLNIIGKVARIICFIIGVIVFISGFISGINIYGVDSLVLLKLTGCSFWVGAELFFGGLEDTFKTVEELSREDDMQNETESSK